MPKTKAQGKHRMTRRELAAALAPAAGAEAEIEAKFLREASADEDWLRTAIARRLRGEPLQYILGEWEFMGLPFYVGPGALIPRQDTETLCEAALAWLKPRPDARVLDLCCGTGCIGVSLAKLDGARVAFADVSPDALALAQRNAARNGVDGIFYESDLFTHVPGVYDLIAGTDEFTIAGVDLGPDSEKSDEYVAFIGEDGSLVAKAEIVYSSLQLVRCQLSAPIMAGSYTLAVFTRSGMGAAYGVKSATRKISVA